MKLYRVRRNFSWGRFPYLVQYKAWEIHPSTGVQIGLPRQTIDSRDRVGFIVDFWAASEEEALVQGILLLNGAHNGPRTIPEHRFDSGHHVSPPRRV